MQNPPGLRFIDLSTVDATDYARRCTSCLVLTREGKIMLQQRGEDWHTFPGYLAVFGGGVEEGETPLEGVMRELQEELGAKPREADIIALGAVTEDQTGHRELVYLYIWRDMQGSITGCYEGEARLFDDAATPLAHPKTGDDLRYLLRECARRGLVPTS